MAKEQPKVVAEDEPTEDYTQNLTYTINIAGDLVLNFNAEVHNVKLNSGKPQPFPPPHG